MRTLGKEKYQIDIASNFKKSFTLCSYSKYCKKTHFIKVDIDDTDSYAMELLNIIKNEKYDVLLPVGLKSYLAASKYKEKFQELTKTVVPDWEKMQITFNKDKTMSFSKDIGIPIPETKVLYTDDDINEVETYPLVIKSSDDSGNYIKYCNNKSELINNFKKLRRISKTNIIAQEYIRGFGCGFYGVYNNGNLIAHFLHKRIKEYPVTGGPSAVAESYFDDKLYNYGKKLCDALKWHGPIMAEFKYDIKNDEYKLIEINPKLWGSLDLTIEAGVNVPEILVNLALNKKIDIINKYKSIRYRWVFPDEIKALVSEFSIIGLKDFIRKYENTKSNLNLDDPLPTIIQIGHTLVIIPLIIFSRAKRNPHGKPIRT